MAATSLGRGDDKIVEVQGLALKLAHLIAPASNKDAVVPRDLADALIEALSRSSS